MGSRNQNLDKIKLVPHIRYAEDFPEITRLDVTLESYLSRMDSISDILEEHGGFSHKTVMGTLVCLSGNPEHSEEVAQWLRGELLQLREDEKVQSKAPVLSGTSLGRATISDIAITMLEAIEPGPQLLLLLAELLNVDRHRQARADNKNAERDIAAQIDAQIPGKGVRQLAKEVGVAPSTITTWRNETEYQKHVEFYKKLFSGDFERELISSLRKAK